MLERCRRIDLRRLCRSNKWPVNGDDNSRVAHSRIHNYLISVSRERQKTAEARYDLPQHNVGESFFA